MMDPEQVTLFEHTSLTAFIRPETTPPDRVVCLVYGGIGDVALFSPVFDQIRDLFPQVHLTAIVENRSKSVMGVIPTVDRVVGFEAQGVPRHKVFQNLLSLLKQGVPEDSAILESPQTKTNGTYQVVISCGSSPFIPVLLWLSQIPIRVGYDTGALSQKLLTHPAPLHRSIYAAEMYFSLAQTWIDSYLTEAGKELSQQIPHIPRFVVPMAEADESCKNLRIPEFLQTLEDKIQLDPQRLKILIHPGVSLASVKKNILKGWSPDDWAQYIRRMADQYWVVLVGGPDDEAIVQQIRTLLEQKSDWKTHYFIDMVGKTKDFLALGQLIQWCDLFVCVDSAPLHLSIGLHKPTVAMFGPTNEKTLLPPQLDFIQAVAIENLPCRPCLWDFRTTSCDQPHCLDVSVDAMELASKNQLVTIQRQRETQGDGCVLKESF